MLSTKSTILENWQGPKDTEHPRPSVRHFALNQVGANLDFHLEQFFRGQEISFHRFDTFENLVTVCQRFPVEAVFISGQDDLIRAVDLVRSIKHNMFLSIIPVILYHPDPEDNAVIAAYESGVEEFIYGEWKDHLIQVRICRVLERSRRDLSINPSTHLPGPTMIEHEIDRQLQQGSEFGVCYADLDNFKAYNDYYGYSRGDKVIQLTSRVIKDIVFDLCREGFVGHIAGDDFIFIVPADLIQRTCGEIIKAFDALIPCKYEQQDRERGYIETRNRRRQTERFPLLTVSIAVEVNSGQGFAHIGQLSKMLADLKNVVKMKQGSNYVVERRRNY